jgi:predicted N-acetyltransferase YhbS
MMAGLKISTRKPSPVQLKALYRQAPWAKSRPLSAIRTALKHSDLVFSAWRGAALVGFCRLSTDFAFRAVLWDVIVDEAEHGQGIGTALVKAAVTHPRLKKIQGIWLFTTDKQAFYSKLGFKAYPKNLMLLKR